jgi:hypothetical protein
MIMNLVSSLKEGKLQRQDLLKSIHSIKQANPATASLNTATLAQMATTMAPALIQQAQAANQPRNLSTTMALPQTSQPTSS